MQKPWSEEQMQFLRENYKSHGTDYCAKHIGKKKHCIIRMANKNGLYIKKYSDEEVAYLEKMVGRTSYRSMAEKLGRDYTKIKAYMCRHYLQQQANETNLTMAEIGRLVGRDRSTVRKCWVVNGKLKSRKVGKNVLIYLDDLLEFMQNNPKLWDATKCDRYFFGRYEWFEEKRKQDFDKMVEKRWGKVV